MFAFFGQKYIFIIRIRRLALPSGRGKKGNKLIAQITALEPHIFLNRNLSFLKLYPIHIKIY